MQAATRTEDTQTTPRKYTRRSEAQWRELITNFDDCDLTLEAYCQHHKIAPSGFYAWRKRFEREVGQNINAEAFIEITPQLRSQSPSKQSEEPTWQVELELGYGRVLRIKTV